MGTRRVATTGIGSILAVIGCAGPRAPARPAPAVAPRPALLAPASLFDVNAAENAALGTEPVNPDCSGGDIDILDLLARSQCRVATATMGAPLGVTLLRARLRTRAMLEPSTVTSDAAVDVVIELVNVGSTPLVLDLDLDKPFILFAIPDAQTMSAYPQDSCVAWADPWSDSAARWTLPPGGVAHARLPWHPVVNRWIDCKTNEPIAARASGSYTVMVVARLAHVDAERHEKGVDTALAALVIR